MNNLTKINIYEVLDKEPFFDDADIRQLNVLLKKFELPKETLKPAEIADQFVSAFSSAWKKNKLMYLYLGKKMVDLRDKDKEVWKEVRIKLQKKINNGTISNMLSVAEHYEWFAARIDYLPNSLVGLNKLAKETNEKKREQAVVLLKDNFKNDKREITEKDVDNALRGKKASESATRSNSKKNPTVISIQMTVDNYNAKGQEILDAIEKARIKLNLSNRVMKVVSKEIQNEE